jgi:hypothetical protein
MTLHTFAYLVDGATSPMVARASSSMAPQIVTRPRSVGGPLTIPSLSRSADRPTVTTLATVLLTAGQATRSPSPIAVAGSGVATNWVPTSIQLCQLCRHRRSLSPQVPLLRRQRRLPHRQHPNDLPETPALPVSPREAAASSTVGVPTAASSLTATSGAVVRIAVVACRRFLHDS